MADALIGSLQETSIDIYANSPGLSRSLLDIGRVLIPGIGQIGWISLIKAKSPGLGTCRSLRPPGHKWTTFKVHFSQLFQLVLGILKGKCLPWIIDTFFWLNWQCCYFHNCTFFGGHEGKIGDLASHPVTMKPAILDYRTGLKQGCAVI